MQTGCRQGAGRVYLRLSSLDQAGAARVARGGGRGGGAAELSTHGLCLGLVGAQHGAILQTDTEYGRVAMLASVGCVYWSSLSTAPSYTHVSDGGTGVHVQSTGAHVQCTGVHLRCTGVHVRCQCKRVRRPAADCLPTVCPTGLLVCRRTQQAARKKTRPFGRLAPLRRAPSGKSR